MTDTAYVPNGATDTPPTEKAKRTRGPKKSSSDRVTLAGVTYLDHIHGDQFIAARTTLDVRLVTIDDATLADEVKAAIAKGKGEGKGNSSASGRIRPTVVDFPEAS